MHLLIIHSSGADYYIFLKKTIDFFIVVWYNIYVNKERAGTLINKTEKRKTI